MKKRSKRYKKLIELSKDKKNETIDEAIKKIKKNCTTKFDESIDVSCLLNLKSKKEEVNLRTLVNLPNGNGKKLNGSGSVLFGEFKYDFEDIQKHKYKIDPNLIPVSNNPFRFNFFHNKTSSMQITLLCISY